MTAPTPEDHAGSSLPEQVLPREAAEYFRVKPFTVLTWLKDPEIFPNAFKIGTSWRIPREDIYAHARRLQGDRTGALSPKVNRRRDGRR